MRERRKAVSKGPLRADESVSERGTKKEETTAATMAPKTGIAKDFGSAALKDGRKVDLVAGEKAFQTDVWKVLRWAEKLVS